MCGQCDLALVRRKWMMYFSFCLGVWVCELDKREGDRMNVLNFCGLILNAISLFLFFLILLNCEFLTLIFFEFSLSFNSVPFSCPHHLYPPHPSFSLHHLCHHHFVISHPPPLLSSISLLPSWDHYLPLIPSSLFPLFILCSS